MKDTSRVRFNGTGPRWYEGIGNVEPGDEKEVSKEKAASLLLDKKWSAVTETATKAKATNDLEAK